MIVPHNQLHPDTLRSLIEEFVSRDGAVHGHRDVNMETSILQVIKMLEKRRMCILFDAEDESTTIMPVDQLPPHLRIEFDAM